MPVYTGILAKSPVFRPYFCDFIRIFVILCRLNALLCCLEWLKPYASPVNCINCTVSLESFRASRQLPPGQLPPGQVPPGQVPLWTSSTSDKFPPDKFPFGQLSPGQVPLPGKHLKRTSSPRTTSPRTSSPRTSSTSDKFPPRGKLSGGKLSGGELVC